METVGSPRSTLPSVMRAMKARGGAIVNIASVSSWLPIDAYAGYSASKAAVIGLTKSLGKELAHKLEPLSQVELIEKQITLVTEMTEVKHPFRAGVKAQQGIEF